jgi:hypothetical protein
MRKGEKSVPRYYFGSVRQYDEFKFGYLVRITDDAFIGTPIDWLKIDAGRLYISGRQVSAVDDKLRLAVSENDSLPQLIDLDLAMTERFLALRSAEYNEENLSQDQKIKEIVSESESFWIEIQAKREQPR